MSIVYVQVRSNFERENLFLDDTEWERQNSTAEMIQNKKDRMALRQTAEKEGPKVRQGGEVKLIEEERWRRKEARRGDGKRCGPWLLLMARIGPGKQG